MDHQNSKAVSTAFHWHVATAAGTTFRQASSWWRSMARPLAPSRSPHLGRAMVPIIWITMYGNVWNFEHHPHFKGYTPLRCLSNKLPSQFLFISFISLLYLLSSTHSWGIVFAPISGLSVSPRTPEIHPYPLFLVFTPYISSGYIMLYRWLLMVWSPMNNRTTVPFDLCPWFAMFENGRAIPQFHGHCGHEVGNMSF